MDPFNASELAVEMVQRIIYSWSRYISGKQINVRRITLIRMSKEPLAPGEVRIHSNEQIHNLLCGKQQLVGTSLSTKPQVPVSTNDLTDFSKYPFPDPIEPVQHSMAPQEHAQQKASSLHQVPVKQFNKIRQDEQSIQQIGKYLNVYETNHKRKSMLLHQELEEHFLQPLARKLVRKTNGPEYNEYVKKRDRAVSAFDQQTKTQDTFLKQLPPIPMISFDTSDLTDPILKYKKHAQHEQRLSDFISKSTGEVKPHLTFPERDTMNLKKWRILAETRFYAGKSEPGEGPNKGKRVFEQKYKDQIVEETDQFAPPLPPPAYIERPTWESRTDHIKFEEE